MDIIVFGGQSNMQGQTESCPNREPIQGAYEYFYKSDLIKPLRHPVGEDIDDLILGAHEGHGNLTPSFCRAYVKRAGCEVCAVSASRGATVIDDWQCGSPRYNCALNKINAAVAAVKKTAEVRNIFYVWLQGESDALKGTGTKEYLDKLIQYKNDLKRDAHIHKFGIIQVGYFTCEHDRDLKIMQAQQKASECDGDFIMLTTVTKKLSLDPEFINPYAAGHYNNAAMDIIGTRSGATLARYAAGEEIGTEEDL